MIRKQQFNIYLPPELIRLVKHKAVDSEQSLSTFVEAALNAYIAGLDAGKPEDESAQEKPVTGTGGSDYITQLMSMLYTSKMTEAVRFYRALGLETTKQGNLWSELGVGEARVGLQTTDPYSRGDKISLVFVTRVPLEDVIKRLVDNGVIVENDISDEAYGRALLIHDPDGVAIMINEYDPELYP